MKFCPKCGSEIKSGSFCGVCGSQIGSSNNQAIEVAEKEKHSGISTKIIAIGVAVVIAIGIGSCGGYYYYQSTKAEAAAAEQAAKAEAFAATPEGKAQKLLEARGVNGTVLATTYKADNESFLALIDSAGNKVIAAFDAKNNLALTVENPAKVFGVLKNTGKKYNSIIFTLDIKNAPHGEDDKFGEWDGTSHKLPVFVAYQINNKAEVEPGMINSGVGTQPKQYKSYLQESVHVDLTNLVLTNVKALKATMDEKHIQL